MAAGHSPRQNKLLATLPERNYEGLLRHLQPVALPLATTIHLPGDCESHLYFIADGLVSRACVTRDGASAEFALTGNEGVIGLASVLSGESSPARAVVVSEGYGYRLPASIAKRELEREGPLARLLLRYTLALMAQAGQVAACNRHHSLEQRLCRLMLWSTDRLHSDELAMKQESIAEMLGVRREGVSEAAANLQRQGLIRYTRGCIAIIDRSRMETRVCECYAAVKREYDRLLPRRQGARRDEAHGVPVHELTSRSWACESSCSSRSGLRY